MPVVEEPIEERDCCRVLRQEAAPFLERPVGADPEAAPVVGAGYEAEQELAAHVVERRKAELVDHDQVGPQQALDESPDTVVGEAPIQRLHERGGGEVAPR